MAAAAASGVPNSSGSRFLSAAIEESPKTRQVSEISQRVIKAFLAIDFSKKTKSDIAKLNSEELEGVLSECLNTLVSQLELPNGKLKKSLRILTKIAEVIPPETLRQAIARSFNQREDLLTARHMFEEALYYLEQTKGRISPSLMSYIRSCINAGLAFLDSIFKALGVSELFEPSHSQMDGQMKMHKIMMLASIFMLLASTILPLFGVETGGFIVGGFMLAMAILSLIYPKFRSRRDLWEGFDLTSEVYKGNYIPVRGRDDTVRRIAGILSSSKDAYAMLLAKTGAGKTKLVHSLTQRIVKGEFPKLKGKIVVYFNMAKIAQIKDFIQGSNKWAEEVTKDMGNHKDEYILVLDEFHAIAANPSLVEEFKLYIDSSNLNGFRKILAISTEEEYNKCFFQNNPAVSRRFKPVVLKNTNDQETLEILVADFLREPEASKISMDKSVLKTIIIETNKTNRVQPGYAIQILNQCIQAATPERQQSRIELEMDALKSKLRSLYATQIADLTDSEAAQSIVQVGEELIQLERKLKLEKIALQAIKKLRDTRLEVIKAAYRKIIAANQTKGKKHIKLVNEAFLLLYFYASAFDRRIRKLAEECGIRVAITDDLVRETIKKDSENEMEVRRLIEAGAKAAEERNGIGAHIRMTGPAAQGVPMPASVVATSSSSSSSSSSGSSSSSSSSSNSSSS